MPDWEEIMRTRLRGLGASAEQQSEIASEMAGHLEDLYERSRLEGLPEEEAVARALAVIGDEAELRRKISQALRDGEFVGDWRKCFWLPALFVTAVVDWAYALISINRYNTYLDALQHSPAAIMTMVSTQSHFLLLSVVIPILAAAIGGLWSWLAGGGFWQRLLAGLSPGLAVPATMLIGVAAGLFQGFPMHYRWVAGQLQCFFSLTTLHQFPYMLLGLSPFLLLKPHSPRRQAAS